MHCAGDSGAGKGMMDGVRPERGVARPIAFTVPSRQAPGIASRQRPIAAASRVRNGTPAAAEMPPASGEVTAAAMAAAEVSPTTVTTAAMSATTMSATAMTAPAVTAPTSPGCINRPGQRDRQHDDRQPFDVGHDISSSGSGADFVARPIFERRAAAQLGHVDATTPERSFEFPQCGRFTPARRIKTTLSRYSPSRSRR
jgi:hypothetical protein